MSEGFPGNASVHAGSGVCAAICAQSRRTADVSLLPSAFPESYFGDLSTVWGRFETCPYEISSLPQGEREQTHLPSALCHLPPATCHLIPEP
ncbi:MAG: hypothetical protein LBU53_12895 [Zoogloeaceae bacterium]|nr:hypothetical protein [Zoogloeaceae bacterium]